MTGLGEKGQLEGDKIVTGLQLPCVALIDLNLVRSLVCCFFFLESHLEQTLDIKFFLVVGNLCASNHTEDHQQQLLLWSSVWLLARDET